MKWSKVYFHLTASLLQTKNFNVHTKARPNFECSSCCLSVFEMKQKLILLLNTKQHITKSIKHLIADFLIRWPNLIENECRPEKSSFFLFYFIFNAIVDRFFLHHFSFLIFHFFLSLFSWAWEQCVQRKPKIKIEHTLSENKFWKTVTKMQAFTK